MSPSCLMMKSCSTDVGAAGVNSKTYSSTRSDGAGRQMACLLSSGYANDRQIKGLLITYCKLATLYVLTILSTALRTFTETQGEFNDYCGKIAAGGEQSKALHIAKIMLESGVPLQTSCALPGCQKKSWLRRASNFCLAISKVAYTLCFNATSSDKTRPDAK